MLSNAVNELAAEDGYEVEQSSPGANSWGGGGCECPGAVGQKPVEVPAHEAWLEDYLDLK